MQTVGHHDIQKPEYQRYAVLSMCRVLYTLEHHTLVSKPVAASWAKQRFGSPYDTIIDKAVAGLTANLEEAQEMIKMTVDYIQRQENESIPT